jgi:hypothetical protein
MASKPNWGIVPKPTDQMGLVDAALTPVLFAPPPRALQNQTPSPLLLPPLLPHHYLRSTWRAYPSFPVPSMGCSITIHWAKATRSGTPRDSQAGKKENDVQLKAKSATWDILDMPLRPSDWTRGAQGHLTSFCSAGKPS